MGPFIARAIMWPAFGFLVVNIINEFKVLN